MAPRSLACRRSWPAPLSAELDLIEGLQSTGDLGSVLGQLIHNTDGTAFFIGLGSEQDAKQSDVMIGAVHAAGLSLPDRDYYLADDPVKRDNREQYVEHVAAMFRLLGDGDGPALPAALPHQRRGGEHAGIPGCLRLPRGIAHGQAGRGNLPDLVRADLGPTTAESLLQQGPGCLTWPPAPGLARLCPSLIGVVLVT